MEKKSVKPSDKKGSLDPEEVMEDLREGIEQAKKAIEQAEETEERVKKLKKVKIDGDEASESESNDDDEEEDDDDDVVSSAGKQGEEEDDEITVSGIGPKINSADPQERKMARRLRIQKRLNIAKKQKKTHGGIMVEDFEEDEPKTIVEQQILNSIIALDKMIMEGNEQVTNVRVGTDAREVKRRQEQEEAKLARLKMIENEEHETGEQLEEIALKWSMLAEANDPLDIYDEMEIQKQRCEELVKRKDEIIERLSDELNKSHEQFTRDQKKQKDDVNILSDRIDNHIKMMQKAYKQELLLLEEAIKMEQSELIEECEGEWKELYDGREKQEVENMKKKFELILDYEKEMDSIYVEHHEKFRDAKIRLEGDIHVLQQELEKVKALCLLNSEKLDYNFQILKKRDDENLLMKAHQKRRINKLQDVVNRLRGQIEDIEKTISIEKHRLQDQVSKLHANIIDVGRKADHFADVNDRKYHKIWEMNEKIASDLLDKILTADRIIHEQQLGLEWEAPLLSPLSRKDLPSYCSAMRTVDSLFRQKMSQEVTDSTLSGLNEIHTIKMKGDLLRHILERIADKSGFLIEEKIFALLFPFKKTEKTLVKIENIFMALGIQTTEDVEMLKKYFIPYLSCEICGYSPSAQASEASSREEEEVECEEKKEEEEPEESIKSSEEGASEDEVDVLSSLQRGAKCSQEFKILDVKKYSKKKRKSMKEEESNVRTQSTVSEIVDTGSDDMDEESLKASEESKKTRDWIEECDPTHPLKIDPIYVLKALRSFVADFSKNKEIVCETMSDRLAKDRKTVSRSLKAQDVSAYWERYTLIFPPDREKVWDALLIGLHKYHQILKERHGLNEEVQSLRRQNEELKHLLQQYMRTYGGCGRRILPPLKPLPRCWAECKPKCKPKCIRKC